MILQVAAIASVQQLAQDSFVHIKDGSFRQSLSGFFSLNFVQQFNQHHSIDRIFRFQNLHEQPNSLGILPLFLRFLKFHKELLEAFSSS